MKKTQGNITPYDNKTFNTMVPGPFMRFMRTCKIWQFIRFVIINLKMIRVVAKSH
jgi:hypothetical protein